MDFSASKSGCLKNVYGEKLCLLLALRMILEQILHLETMLIQLNCTDQADHRLC